MYKETKYLFLMWVIQSVSSMCKYSNWQMLRIKKYEDLTQITCSLLSYLNILKLILIIILTLSNISL